MDNKILGRAGEALAEQYLEDKGYRIIERNFRNKLGEIDLIVKDGKTICFVEVKTRKSLACGMPYESVHYFKQRKMINLALSYLKFRFGTPDILARFDVISVYNDLHGATRIEHIINAFELG